MIMPLQRKSSRRGAALATVLLIMMIVLFLGVMLLSSIQTDTHFQRHQELAAQAYYLALAGVEYCKNTVCPDIYGTPVTYAVPPGSTFQFFQVQNIEATTYGTEIRSRGFIQDWSGKVIEETTLIVPGGELGDKTYEQ